jgi:PAS domain S-box-containing protein
MQQEELFTFLGKTADTAFGVNERGEVCFWSEAAEKLFGWSKKRALHNSCYALLQGSDVLSTPTLTKDLYARELSREQWGTSFGRRIWVNLSSLLFEDSRSHYRLVLHLARDISERKKREELLDNMLLVFKQLKAANGGRRPSPISPLSGKEQGILQLFWRGKSASEVARDQQITLQTLRNHLHHINEKLGTHDRLQAVVHAMHRNLL